MHYRTSERKEGKWFSIFISWQNEIDSKHNEIYIINDIATLHIVLANTDYWIRYGLFSFKNAMLRNILAVTVSKKVHIFTLYYIIFHSGKGRYHCYSLTLLRLPNCSANKELTFRAVGTVYLSSVIRIGKRNTVIPSVILNISQQ